MSSCSRYQHPHSPRLCFVQRQRHGYSQTPSPLLILARKKQTNKKNTPVLCLAGLYNTAPACAAWCVANAASPRTKRCFPNRCLCGSPMLFRALPLTCLLLRGHATVTVSGQRPWRWADAVVGAWRVHTLAVLTVGWVLTLVHICREDKGSFKTLGLSRPPSPLTPSHNTPPGPPIWYQLSLTCYRDHHTLLLVVVRSPGVVAVAVEGAFRVDAVAVGAQRLVVAFVHIWQRGGWKMIRGPCRTAPPSGLCQDFGCI